MATRLLRVPRRRLSRRSICDVFWVKALQGVGTGKSYRMAGGMLRKVDNSSRNHLKAHVKTVFLFLC